MQKIAKTAARAIARLELARGLMEVGDGRQLGINGLAIEPSIIQIITRLLGVLLVAKFGVRVAGEVLAHVLADVELLNLAVLGLHFDEELLVRVVEVALQLFACVLVPVGRLRRVERTEVEVAQQHRLAESGPVVQLGALFAVTTCAYFKIKRTVYFVFLGAEYRC